MNPNPKTTHLREWFLHVRTFRRPAVWLIHSLVFALSILLAFLARFDLTVPAGYHSHLLWAMLVLVITKMAVFQVCRLNEGWLCYVSVLHAHRLLTGNIAASSVGSIVILALLPSGFPRSIYFLDFVFSFLLTSGARITVRLIQDLLLEGGKEDSTRVLIYGAGAAGASLCQEIRRSEDRSYQLVGYIDDKVEKKNLEIHGLRILGTGEDLPALVSSLRIDLVLIAIPAADGRQMARILEHCHDANVKCKTMPALQDIIEERALTSQIRDVAVEDLLGRTPVQLDECGIRSKIEGRVVLVTGAAGSIGSELCRQIARFAPRAIVGLDIAETPLFYLDLEMRERFPDIDFRPEVASVQNRNRLGEIMARHAPSLLFHAAAYKHVPMMEAHPFEAAENNIFGTRNAAEVAALRGVRDFVMISSDKAVRPASVMGVTKRVAELIMQDMQHRETKFVSVRFGNVLGSSGSVVPLFRQQIARGGPVRVTHPEMSRYFMTIPEAAQLVLQASAMGSGGEIFVLDMGDPVKIIDLASRLILLSGLRPGVDIAIEYTGIRPGEKLFEELSTTLEETLPTSHQKIRIFAGNGLPGQQALSAYMNELATACDCKDLGRMIITLKDLVPEYNPSARLLRHVIRPARTIAFAASA